MRETGRKGGIEVGRERENYKSKKLAKYINIV